MYACRSVGQSVTALAIALALSGMPELISLYNENRLLSGRPLRQQGKEPLHAVQPQVPNAAQSTMRNLPMHYNPFGVPKLTTSCHLREISLQQETDNCGLNHAQSFCLSAIRGQPLPQEYWVASTKLRGIWAWLWRREAAEARVLP